MSDQVDHIGLGRDPSNVKVTGGSKQLGAVDLVGYGCLLIFFGEVVLGQVVGGYFDGCKPGTIWLIPMAAVISICLLPSRLANMKEHGLRRVLSAVILFVVAGYLTCLFFGSK